MPTTQIELTGINCQMAGRIIREGVDELQQLFADGDVVSYRCAANEWDVSAGSIVFGPAYIRPPEWLGIVVIYALCVFALLASLYYLKRKGASSRDFFYWGALALIVPVLGPLVVMLFYRLAARQNG